jgi:gliding motility-associated-like protein
VLLLDVVPDQTTIYYVTVVDSSGCFATAELMVPVDKSRPVYVPNAFSPNNDGINDLLVLFGGKSVSQIKSFLIFSRWGESVFEFYNIPHSDFNYGWDGTYRGKILDAGVYTWFAEVEFVDGEIIMFEGDVTLIR